MRKAGFYFLGAVLSVSAVVLGAGCGPSEGGTSGSGGSSSSSTTGGTGGTTSSSTGEMSSSTTGGGMAATCDSYCADITANCTADVAQYASADACKAACKDIMTQGKAGDTSGASLECRAYHAKAAAMDAKLHCPHAGPTGGDKDVSDTKEGACGDGCATFCEIALAACAGPKTYADMTTCMTDCRKFPASAGDYSSTYYSSATNWKNDFGCRMYHLTVAAQSDMNATMHCPHITSTSTACTK